MIKRLLFQLYQWYLNTSYSAGKGFLSRLFSKLGFAKYNIRGIHLYLSPVGIIDRYLINGAELNSILVEEMEKKLKPGDYFLDVGANIGYFSLLAASKFDAQVFSFEPSPRELKRFLGNISLNQSSCITCFPYGLGKEDGDNFINLTDCHNPTMNYIGSKFKGESHRIRVKSANNLISKNILNGVRICKIDVEGYETEVIQGFGADLGLMKECTFIVEVTPEFLIRANSSVKELYDCFELHGFIPKYGIIENHQWEEVWSYNTKRL
tara:strand:+ start:3514 stop:4311 length:798 start_codon:yes stop_codon:yes gene_type:complete